MKEVNAAYEEIQKIRQGGSSGGYGSGSSYSGSVNYANIRRNINTGNIGAAEAELNSINQGDRGAEWHYLMGCVLIKKGYYVDAQRMISTACQMDPANAEYRAARDRLRARANGYGNTYSTTYTNSGCCPGLDCCTTLLCANCLCRICGGRGY
jgi:hypothetical protein